MTDPISVKTPPARLYSIFDPLVSNAEHEGKVTGHVLALAMGRENGEVQGVWYAAHVEVMGLLDGAESYVRDRTLDYDNSPHRRTFATLRQYFSELHLNNSWQNYRRNFEPLITIALPFSIHAAELDAQAVSIDPASVETVKSKLDGLIQAVKDSDYPAEFRTELLSALVQLKDKITRFEVFGPEGIKAVTAAVVGTMVVNEAVVKTNREIAIEAADLINTIADVFLKSYAVAHLIGQTVLGLLRS